MIESVALSSGSMNPWIREPAVAGRFYPATRAALEREMARCLGPDLAARRVQGIVGPHAATLYSGAVAGAAYARIRVPRRCIVLSPNHTGRGATCAIWPRGAWKTPLGDVPVDEALAEQLQKACPLLREDRPAHVSEHSLEVHLPFLKTRRTDVTIVPITLGHMPYVDCAQIGRAIAEVVRAQEDEILIVASTDMSHYLPADEARALDAQALDRITALDDAGLYDVVGREDISMCGIIPTTVALAAARALNVRQAELIRYGHSGEVSGDHSSVVGYASVTMA